MFGIDKKVIGEHEIYEDVYKRNYFKSNNALILKLLAGSFLLFPLILHLILYGVNSNSSFFFYTEYGVVIILFELLYFLLFILSWKDGGHRLDGIILLGQSLFLPIYLFSFLFLDWFVSNFEINSSNIQQYYSWFLLLILLSLVLSIYRYVIEINYLKHILKKSPTTLGFIFLYVKVIDAWIIGFVDSFVLVSSSIIFLLSIFVSRKLELEEKAIFLILLNKFKSNNIEEINLKEISNLPIHRFFTYGNEIELFKQINSKVDKFDLVFRDNNILLVKNLPSDSKIIRDYSLLTNKNEVGNREFGQYWISTLFIFLLGIITYFLLLPIILQNQSISEIVHSSLLWLVAVVMILPMIKVNKKTNINEKDNKK